MLKFIPGTMLLQIITAAYVLVASGNSSINRRIFPTFWFGSLTANRRKDEISRVSWLASERMYRLGG
jgi:hypothetical protein